MAGADNPIRIQCLGPRKLVLGCGYAMRIADGQPHPTRDAHRRKYSGCMESGQAAWLLQLPVPALTNPSQPSEPSMPRRGHVSAAPSLSPRRCLRPQGRSRRIHDAATRTKVDEECALSCIIAQHCPSHLVGRSGMGPSVSGSQDWLLTGA